MITDTCQVYYTQEEELFLAKSANYDIGIISAQSIKEMNEKIEAALIKKYGKETVDKLIVRIIRRASI